MFALLDVDGDAAGVVSIGNESVANVDNAASITYENDGTLTAVGTGLSGSTWVTPQVAGVAAQYEIRASSASGDTGQLTGSLDTWLALSSDRTWQLNAGNFSVTFTIEIRDKFNLVVRDSASIQLDTATS